ncbi:CDP-alcohol phosphatidyltransferase family protein [Nanoarchaeota archaeon]
MKNENRYNLPNLVTTMRLLLLGVTWYFALRRENKIVGVLLVFAFLTDALDGFLARRLGQETKFGAKYDSVADNLLALSIIIWLPILLPDLLRENLLLVSVVVILFLIVLAFATIKYRRIPEFHMYSNKLAMIVLAIFITHALIFGYSLILTYISALVIILMALEEFAVTLKHKDLDENIKSIFEK